MPKPKQFHLVVNAEDDDRRSLIFFFPVFSVSGNASGSDQRLGVESSMRNRDRLELRHVRRRIDIAGSQNHAIE